MLFKDVAALVIFLLVILFVIVLVLVPVTVKLPTRSKARLRIKQLTISYAAVPVAGAILMLCTGSLTGQTLAKGIVGDPHLKPYGIVILFLALAYISTSLDSTGCLAWLALHITRLSKGNGVALFGLYFGLSSVITALLSNDVSIMTLTVSRELRAVVCMYQWADLCLLLWGGHMGCSCGSELDGVFENEQCGLEAA